MHVLYFHQHFSTPDGSTGIRSYQMARNLVARGHMVTMVCGSYGGGKTGINIPFKKGRREGWVDGIRVIEFDVAYSNSDAFIKRGLKFIQFAFRSIGVALTEKYDLLFATTTPLTAALPGIFARWLYRKKFVFEVRDLWPELPREMGVISNPLVLAAMSFLEWSAYKSAHALVALSPGIKKGIERLGVPESRVALIPNGCDISIFSEGDESWRPEGVAIDDLMAVFAGTHGIANGLDAVIQAAEILKLRKRNDIKLVLVGQGKLKEALIKKAAEKKLSNIIFHQPVNKQLLAGLLNSADVGMQLLANVPAFYYGTSPNKFFDYIAAGLPVLNNYPGWVADLINENNCGLVVPPDDAESFADALEYFADNREVLPQMELSAKKLAASHFDRNELAKNFAGWLEENSAELRPKRSV